MTTADAILFPKDERLVLKALTDLARDKPCMVQLDVCRGDSSTTVWAHSNLARHGRGMSLKSHDCFGFFACDRCHYEIDYGKHMPREMKEHAMQLAMERTLLYLWRHGLIKVAA